jgi:uncharacterized membrane protein YhhN
MGKRIILGGIVVFVTWAVLDYVIHGVILAGAYAATASLWRPMGEMKLGVMVVALFISALAFAALYAWMVERKSAGRGFTFGLLYGIATGVAMGYGTYAVMPIPYGMAFTWFLGTVVEGSAAGVLLGLVVKRP